jgi:hypothetical protein
VCVCVCVCVCVRVCVSVCVCVYMRAVPVLPCCMLEAARRNLPSLSFLLAPLIWNVYSNRCSVQTGAIACGLSGSAAELERRK